MLRNSCYNLSSFTYLLQQVFRFLFTSLPIHSIMHKILFAKFFGRQIFFPEQNFIRPLLSYSFLYPNHQQHSCLYKKYQHPTMEEIDKNKRRKNNLGKIKVGIRQAVGWVILCVLKKCRVQMGLGMLQLREREGDIYFWVGLMDELGILVKIRHGENKGEVGIFERIQTEVQLE